MRNGMRPIHPGEILNDEYLVPMKMSASAFARELKVPPNRVTEIISGQRAVTAETALRFARALRTSAEFWMNLQGAYDLRNAEIESLDTVLSEVKPLSMAG
jgi:antitoxin HigA-1